MSKFDVEIKDAKVDEIKGRSAKTGNDYHIRKQTGWIDLGKAFPLEVEINLDRDQEPYPVGKYLLSDESFYIDRNKRLAVRPVLTALQIHKPSSIPQKSA